MTNSDTKSVELRARDTVTTTSRDDRFRMLRAMHALEAALAVGFPSREQLWMTKVAAATVVLREAMQRQQDEFRSNDGILQQIAHDAPRLANQVEQLRDLHNEALTNLDRLRARTQAYKSSTSTNVDDVRRELADVLAIIRRLQANEADLIYEAYQMDIGGGD